MADLDSTITLLVEFKIGTSCEDADKAQINAAKVLFDALMDAGIINPSQPETASFEARIIPRVLTSGFTGKHRCINCGQLKDESDLYYGEKDWACVDPKHGGAEFQRSPIREDYDELTTAFARTLFMFQNPGVLTSELPLDAHRPLIRDYFRTNALAYHVLHALICTAMQSRDRWGKSKAERAVEDAREVRRVMQLLPELRGFGLTDFYESPQQKPQPFGFYCPYCQVVLH